MGYPELELNEVNMMLNNIKMKLPTPVTLSLKGKFKVRRILRWDPLLFYIMLMQAMT